MLILTEKPSVAKDFAKALGCSYSSTDKNYKSADGKTVITNCVGHLFNLDEPAAYDPKFKSWKNLPIIPNEFSYSVNPTVKDVQKTVVSLLKKHKNDQILIATDADREGEIIARECLNFSGIQNSNNLKRFWVSQALIPSVIRDGISNATPLKNYDFLASQGFARQKADWLIGMNATRFVTNKSGTLYPIGRVQTAILSAINDRCNEVKNFKKEKFYNYQGTFAVKGVKSGITGIYSENGKTRFSDTSKLSYLRSLCGTAAKCIDVKRSQKSINPPLLYNLNDLQKDAFNFYGYSAERTLSIVQSLYEKHKCVSYPRTPSRVMGEDNVQLCHDLFYRFISECPEYFQLHTLGVVDGNNKRIFNDSKLEAHHAIIPLDKIPSGATSEEENVFYLILERFMLAFAPVCKLETIAATLDVQRCTFEIKGHHYLEKGWKAFRRVTDRADTGEGEDDQELIDLDWNNLVITEVEALEKFTKPPKHYNEASILSFMENPKNEEGKKLIGLGTPATRHTFIPKLMKSKFIKLEGKNILITETGEKLLSALAKTDFKGLADIGETTRWEERLAENPEAFLDEIKEFVRNGVGGN